MHPGEWWTRGTVWLALALYVMGEIAKAASRDARWGFAARWLNAAGCAAFLAHVACAFHFYHGWSHWAAYADTGRQTAELFGLNWGGGIYFNYVFAMVWLAEALGTWTKAESYRRRPEWITWAVRGFFWFMMFNGAVVFARGKMRWFGLLLCLALVGCWWPKRKATVLS